MHKFIILLVAVCLTSISYASELTLKREKSFLSAKSCGNFVNFSQDYLFLGFGPYKRAFEEPRVPTVGHVMFSSLGASTQFVNLITDDAAIDSVQIGSKLYILTYSSLELWSLETFKQLDKFATYNIKRVLDYREHARAMIRVNDKLIIAHGRLGYSIFDTKSDEIVYQQKVLQSQWPHESQLMDVSLADDKIVFAATGFTLSRPRQPQAFNGLIVVNSKTFKVEHEIPGLDPGVEAIDFVDGKLLFSFNPPIWSYDFQEILQKAKLTNPHRVFRFPIANHGYAKPFFDKENMYACWSMRDEESGAYQKKPVVFKRDLIGL